MPWHKTTDGDEIPQNMNTVLTSAVAIKAAGIATIFALYSATKLPNPTHRIKLLPRYRTEAKQIVDRVKRNPQRLDLAFSRLRQITVDALCRENA